MPITLQDLQPYITNYEPIPGKKNNAMPDAVVPGATTVRNDKYTRSANTVQMLYNLLPYINAAVNQTSLPTALSDLQVAQQTSPEYAKLMIDLYNTYGPQLNAIGNEIQGRNMMAEAQNQLNVLKGPGTELVKGAYDLSQVYDKPYYQTRELGASRLSDLLNSVDLSGTLSTTERDEISKGLARTNLQRGTLNSPSPINTISDAMQYGNAGYTRKLQQQSVLSDAIAKAANFLPAAKSGIDVFQVATGKSSMPNQGNSLFTGITNNDNKNNFGLASNILGWGQAYDTTKMNNEANEKDGFDRFYQLSSIIKNATDSAGTIGKMFGGGGGFGG